MNITTENTDADAVTKATSELEAINGKNETRSEEEMLKLLESCKDNHYWTVEEKHCLVHYGKLCDFDWDKCQDQYFPHRTSGALNARYGKILRGEDTPASTPRLSNILLSTSNSMLKALTPRKPPVKKQEKAEELQKMETIPEGGASPQKIEPLESPEKNQGSAISWILVLGPIVLMYVVFFACYFANEEYLPVELNQLKTSMQGNVDDFVKRMVEWVNGFSD